MKIDAVSIIPLTMPLKNPYEVAYDRFEQAENLLVHIESGRFNGWGCAAPDPNVTGEKMEELLQLGSAVLPSFKNRDPFRRAVLMKELKKSAPGAFSLWAAVDMALWDLIGKKADLPLWKILGGYRNRIRTSVTIGICSRQDTLEQAKDLIQSGISILKIKGGKNVEEDIERLTALRRDIPSSIRIRLMQTRGIRLKKPLGSLKDQRT